MMTFELSSKMAVDRARLRLYRIISNEDLARIGSKLTRWRTVTPYLGLSTAQHEAIENDHRLTEEQRLDSHNLLYCVIQYRLLLPLGMQHCHSGRKIIQGLLSVI